MPVFRGVMVAQENVWDHRKGTFHKIKMANLFSGKKRDHFSQQQFFDTLSEFLPVRYESRLCIVLCLINVLTKNQCINQKTS